MAKVPAKRLAHVAGGLIGEAQTCAIPSRTIQDNLHFIYYTLEGFDNVSGKGGVLARLDQSKACDTVEHYYMVSVLEQFGLGLGFLR